MKITKKNIFSYQKIQLTWPYFAKVATPNSMLKCFSFMHAAFYWNKWWKPASIWNASDGVHVHWHGINATDQQPLFLAFCVRLKGQSIINNSLWR